MMLDCGGGKRHRATNVGDLQPRAVEIIGGRTLGQHARRALVHDLRHELVRVEERTGDGGEQRSFTGATRIVADVSHLGRLVAGQFCVSYRSELLDRCHTEALYEWKIFSRKGAKEGRQDAKQNTLF